MLPRSGGLPQRRACLAESVAAQGPSRRALRCCRPPPRQRIEAAIRIGGAQPPQVTQDLLQCPLRLVLTMSTHSRSVTPSGLLVSIGGPNRRYMRCGRGITVGPIPRNNGIAMSGCPFNLRLKDSLNRLLTTSVGVRVED